MEEKKHSATLKKVRVGTRHMNLIINFMKDRKINYDSEQAKKIFKEGRPKKEKSFRIAAKKLFLTYPRCPMNLDQFEEQMKDKMKGSGIKEFLFVIEEHEDGGIPHIHAYIELNKKIDVKKEDQLDIFEYDPSGESRVSYHGNYTAARNDRNSIEYLLKDSSGEKDEERGTLRMSAGIRNRIGLWNEYMNLDQAMINLAKQGKIEEAMSLLLKEQPRRFLKEGRNLEKNLQEIYLKNIGCQSKYPFESFIIPPRVMKGLKLFRDSFELEETKVFVIQGEPGSGKTAMALSFLEQIMKFRVLIVNDKEDLSFFDPSNHNCILFDDPDFSKMTREALINIFDNQERKVRVRYVHARIKRNVAKVVTTNKPLSVLNSAFGDEALDRRILTVRIPADTKLFDREFTEKILEKNQFEKTRLQKVEILEDEIKQFKIDEFVNIQKDRSEEQDSLRVQHNKWKENLDNFVLRINTLKNNFEIDHNEYIRRLKEYTDRHPDPGHIVLRYQKDKTGTRYRHDKINIRDNQQDTY